MSIAEASEAVLANVDSDDEAEAEEVEKQGISRPDVQAAISDAQAFDSLYSDLVFQATNSYDAGLRRRSAQKLKAITAALEQHVILRFWAGVHGLTCVLQTPWS